MSDQPKPTGEWTAERVKRYYFGGGGDEALARDINTALASEQEAREIAERSAKAWEEDAHRYVTNTENFAKVIKDLNRQLAAEREKHEQAIGNLVNQRSENHELREQLAAERERYIKLCDKANGDMIVFNKQLAAERKKMEGIVAGFEHQLLETHKVSDELQRVAHERDDLQLELTAEREKVQRLVDALKLAKAGKQ